MVLRTASNFDQQHPGQTAPELLQVSLTAVNGGLGPDLRNAYLVGSAVTKQILGNWETWKNGPPPLP
jgi:purine nucleoside permease